MTFIDEIKIRIRIEIKSIGKFMLLLEGKKSV
jgi:hypothetical protein